MRINRPHLTTLALTASLALTGASAAYASGGGAGGGGATTQTPKADSVKISKACTTFSAAAGGGEMLIKASSSDASARLFAYRPDGVLIGEVQNGGGSQYGGTVMPWQFVYSASVTVQSSSGGSITVPTTPFQI